MQVKFQELAFLVLSAECYGMGSTARFPLRIKGLLCIFLWEGNVV